MATPKILSNLLKDLKAKGMNATEANAVATKTLQRAGDLKPGSRTATAQGVRRGKMTPAQQAKTPIRHTKPKGK